MNRFDLCDGLHFDNGGVVNEEIKPVRGIDSYAIVRDGYDHLSAYVVSVSRQVAGNTVQLGCKYGPWHRVRSFALAVRERGS